MLVRRQALPEEVPLAVEVRDPQARLENADPAPVLLHQRVAAPHRLGDHDDLAVGVTPANPDRPSGRPLRSGLVMATLALTATMAAIQQTMVLPLVPDLPRTLDTTADNASWLVTATLLTGAVATPTISRLADMFGKKRMMLVALVVSVLGSTLGILGESLPLLVAARALQGVGMALVPIGIAIMRDELPRDRVPLGVAMISASLAVGAGAGMPFSGLIAEYLNWRSMFWVTAVVGSVLLVAVALVLTESPVRTGGSFDYCGALLFSTALTALLLALSKGSQWGWTSIATLILAGLAFVALLTLPWVPERA